MNYKPSSRKMENFDPDLSPDSQHNLDVAYRLELTYNPKKREYMDSDGCSVRDEFGQELG